MLNEILYVIFKHRAEVRRRVALETTTILIANAERTGSSAS